MSGCPHDHLAVNAVPYVLQDEEGTVVARTVHVRVMCSVCGCSFLFDGPYSPPPADRDELLAVQGAWVSTAHDEIAAKVRPFQAGDAMWASGVMGNA